MRARLRTWGLSAIVAVALLASTEVTRSRAMRHFFATQRYEDVYYLPSAQWLKVVSLGYDDALADLIWIKGLLYFSQELQHRGAVRHVFDYGQAVRTLSPDFREIYSWVATAALYRTSEVTVPDIRRAVDFLRTGVGRFPDDSELAWDLGATMLFELAPAVRDADERERLRAEAVEYLVIAARRGAGPAWIALTNATQLMKLGKAEQAARHLEEMYALAPDEETKEKIAAKIAYLRNATFAEAFARANQQLEQARERDFPYLPTALYLLVGSRPLIDERQLYENHFLPEDLPWESPQDRTGAEPVEPGSSVGDEPR